MLATRLRRPSEFQQLYISTTIFFFSLSLIVIFVPIYLYELGYGLAQIAAYYLLFNKAAHLLTALPAAKLSNALGVKHAMSISYGLFFASAIVLLFIAETPWLIPVAAVLGGMAGCNLSTAYFSCMSQLGSYRRLGRDLALVLSWKKIAIALGVLSGGLISQIFSVQLTLMIVAGLMFLSIIPLMLSPEPIKQNQSLSLRKLPWRRIKWDLISNWPIKLSSMVTDEAWPLFLAVFIFAGAPYAGVGLITSLAIAISIVIAYFFGRLIDRGHGRRLLRSMVPIFSLSHLMRAFIGSPAFAYGFNFASQAPAIGVNLSYHQGQISRGREISHYKLLYFALMEMIYAVSGLILWLTVLLIAMQGHDKLSLQVVFIAASLLTFLILTERFKSLRPPRKTN